MAVRGDDATLAVVAQFLSNVDALHFWKRQLQPYQKKSLLREATAFLDEDPQLDLTGDCPIDPMFAHATYGLRKALWKNPDRTAYVPKHCWTEEALRDESIRHNSHPYTLWVCHKVQEDARGIDISSEQPENVRSAVRSIERVHGWPYVGPGQGAEVGDAPWSTVRAVFPKIVETTGKTLHRWHEDLLRDPRLFSRFEDKVCNFHPRLPGLLLAMLPTRSHAWAALYDCQNKDAAKLVSEHSKTVPY
ncbi:hypothetical protein CMO91_04585 [Candidatus Woesearchaeota archaeon]|nr:hypothetical protein [Candidatus Woesearchaeota archaeon]|tara:strand:+ start:602 stop:1342 length:741 start_codon:yes stop_codon:yes gene_type:complete